MKKSVQVTILGQQFHLKSDAPPERVEQVARFVEEQIHQVTASGRAVDSLQAAILALLNVSAAHLDGLGRPGNNQASEQTLGRLIARIERALS